ncbi:MAG: hypothetical protein H6948_06520 [Zoogloeaceae bacterium]|nr:hypothetical protein [Zoogloeaceae bacterium]
MSNNYFVGLTGSQAAPAVRLLWEDYGFFELDFDFFKDNWGKALGEVKGSAHIVTPIHSDEEAAQVLGAGGVIVHIGDAEDAGDVLRAYFAEHGQPEHEPLEYGPDVPRSLNEICVDFEDYIDGLASVVYAKSSRGRDPIQKTLGAIYALLDDLRGRALGSPVAEIAPVG